MQDTIKVANLAEFAAVPAVLLGFAPEESVVLIAMAGREVVFVSRFDLAHHTLPSWHEDLITAMQSNDCDAVSVLAYSDDAAAGARAVADVRERLADWSQRGVVISQGMCWETEHGQLVGTPEALVAGHALQVWAGVDLSMTRADVVAPIQPPTPADLPRLKELHNEIAAELAYQSDQPARLAGLLGATEPLTESEAVTLALLLTEAEHTAAVLDRLTKATAPQLRARLIDARSRATSHTEADVLGLLGVACWLTGDGAQLSECCEQLDSIHPAHPLRALMHHVLANGIPPSRWETFR